MVKQTTLRPSDIVVACQLTLASTTQFVQLAQYTGLSVGECHNAIRRLRAARLILADERRPVTDVLHAFLVGGVPFAFPPMLGAETIGMPTAHSAPSFAAIVESSDRLVWPDPGGAVRGQSLIPLFPGAPALARMNEPLYDLLTIVDALRVGTARVRRVAADLLAERLSVSTAA
jgi:hypothetical protein